MTTGECLQKIEVLAQSLAEFINTESRRLLSSGAIDLNEYENNFSAPKCIVSVAVHNFNFQQLLNHLASQAEEDRKNLLLF